MEFWFSSKPLSEDRFIKGIVNMSNISESVDIASGTFINSSLILSLNPNILNVFQLMDVYLE